jgi:hypothetical protein
MIASFSASNQVGELMKKEVKRNFKKRKNIELPENQKLRNTGNRRIEYLNYKKRGLIASFF